MATNEERVLAARFSNTRRRMLALLAAATGTSLLPRLPALAQTADTQNGAKPAQTPPQPGSGQNGGAAGNAKPKPKPNCYASKTFGQWTAQASDSQAGAKIGMLDFGFKCDLIGGSFQVSSDYDAKLILYGDPDATKLTKTFLLKPDNRVIARDKNGKTLNEAPLCGVCTGIFNDKVSIVLPLTFSALLRTEPMLDLVVRLGTIEDCGFTMQLDPLRQALKWAVGQHQKLADSAAMGQCEPPEGCFLTTACCELLCLPDDCFELRALRRFRDNVLARAPGGGAAIAEYYRTAPLILQALQGPERNPRLLRLYWRYILPSALAARLGLNRLTYRLYAGMMQQLSQTLEQPLEQGPGQDLAHSL